MCAPNVHACSGVPTKGLGALEPLPLAYDWRNMRQNMVFATIIRKNFLGRGLGIPFPHAPPPSAPAAPWPPILKSWVCHCMLVDLNLQHRTFQLLSVLPETILTWLHKYIQNILHDKLNTYFQVLDNFCQNSKFVLRAARHALVVKFWQIKSKNSMHKYYMRYTVSQSLFGY